ncbi:MAG: hypothetical protein LBQ68_02720, partial [Clostridiales bacterium]|nr:hypothetical protein [Clostridiales bacterium]
MEYVEIAFQWKINGRLCKQKKKCLYSRGRSTSVFDLEDAAIAMFMWDRICNGGTTFADEALSGLEEILPAKEGVTAKSLLEKYWIHSDRTIQEEFDKYAKINTDEHGWCKTYDEYMKYVICNLMNHFLRSILPVKQGLLYYLFKYLERESFEELRKDIQEIPE